MSSRIFVSYARSDERTASALADHLRQLETAGIAEIWFDGHLEIGESWEQRIEQEVARADIALLLISPAYLASTFVTERELPLIAERGSSGVRVIPVILAPCTWRDHPYIGTLQAFNQGRELRAPTTITFGRQVADLVDQVRRIVVAGPAQTQPVASALTIPTAESDTPAERMATTAGRVDAEGVAFKGSQLQTQLYVNASTDVLNAVVCAELGLSEAHRIDWCSPVRVSGFAEFADRRFLEVVGCRHLLAELKEFWPRGGPRWDALATVALPEGATGVILGEGKSYPEEMIGGGAKATPVSRKKIAEAMAATQRALGLSEDPERWLGRYYQFANRLAHMVWLRQQGVESWLVHVCFVDDPHAPTDEVTWRNAIAAMHKELGLGEAELQHVGEVLLPALDRALLVSPGLS